jgi:XXXCH domain-containing protein
MDEKEKIEGEFHRLELADHLEILARKLRLGKFRLGEQDFRVPQRLAGKIKVKEKKGRLEAEVEFRFAAAEPLDEAAQAEIERRLLSFKEVKKRLGVVFGELLKSSVVVAFPQEPVMQEYLELSKEFGRWADPAYAAEMQEYLDHVENLRLAFENRQFDMFQHELRDLQARMTACHRGFA